MKSFASLVAQGLDLPIFFWDERFSSKSANNAIYAKEFKGVENDKYAATIFLQAFLAFIELG